MPNIIIHWYMSPDRDFMAKNTSISLGNHFQRFVEAQVNQGRFGSTSEVVRAGLRLLEERETRLEALRAAIQQGLDSGPAEPFDIDGFVREKDNQNARD